MINVIAVTTENRIIKELPLRQLSSPNIRWFWVDFDQPTDKEILELEKTFHFHPLAIEDCIHKLQRPKLDYYEDFTFFVVHSLHSADEEKEEINFFVGANYFVSFHHHESMEVTEVWDKLISSKHLDNWNQYLIFYNVLDKIVDNYFPIIYRLEDNLNDLENNEKKESMDKLLDQLFDIRHSFLHLRHTVIPMRDLLYRLLNSERLGQLLERREYFSDIHDHLLKLSEMIDSNREVTNDIRDSYLSINSHQTNRVMKVLTVITTIFMPLTFIAGIYGMNFEYMPELTWRYGYFATLSLMLTIGLGMFFWFKKKGWFD
ncbi:magnesium/cobalt transporter CorA [Bacillus luteolus]|uniref:Magnesium transport protein CorA n=1 Tax=Litchfieldia luteola TaxID=682179 RepID=A0ABR9QGJ5_9BACI|nr:magnesium/cobalt transporter CorA [Cytobacillus luteolus]MBE4907613.1 magnesium/cobalt transporter CorA [Cytobacillus luteolus]MBP1941064.1 magnesium transporter [Cytobacillus luteolus]